MQYTLTEVTEIPPDGRGKREDRVRVGFYRDILKVFIENQYKKALVEVPGKTLDNVSRRLLIHAPHEVSVISREDGVYLRNNTLVKQDESDI